MVGRLSGPGGLRQTRLAWWRRLAAAALAVAAAVLAFGCPPAGAASGAGIESIFLGGRADHLVDPSGDLQVEAATAAAFAPATGSATNRGVSPSPRAALWLRVTIPEGWALGGAVLSLQETRIRRAVLYLPQGDGWAPLVWDPRADHAAGRPLLRFPAFRIDGAALAGRTVLLRVETPSSMRALLWLESERSFAVSYGRQGFTLGGLIGVQIGLVTYLFAVGLALRDGALLRLGGLVLAFLLYVTADRAFLETTVWPGAFTASRVLSLSCTFLLYAAWISFESCYLRVDRFRPRLARLARIGTWLLALCAVQAAVEILADLRFLRAYSAYLGLAALLAGVGVALAMLRHEWRRAAAFLVCWTPAIAGGAARLLLDAVPGLAAEPFAVNAVYLGVSASLLVFGVVTSLDIQSREQGLLQAAQAGEARVRSFAAVASDGFWETDAELRVVYLAGQVCIHAGLRPERDILRSLEAEAGDDREAYRNLELALRERRPFRSLLLPVRSSAGLRFVALSGAPVTDARGRHLGFRGTLSDVTQEHLRRERHDQQQKVAALGALAGGIAHEINNLLHPIINLTRRIRDGLEPGDDRRYLLGIVLDAGDRAREIVASVLTSVRPTPAGGDAVPAHEAVRQAIDAIMPIVPRAVTLCPQIAPVEPLRLPAGEVLQVISNLVGNALHALHGAGRIQVLLRPDPAGGAALVVADDGAGMDEEHRRRALEPFFTTRSQRGGAGLGLPIVFGIVSAWNGTIDIRSAPGQGTEVVIRWGAGTVGGRERGDEAEHPGRR